ncbi:MAG: type IX secretion system membrane protein PorP/SprF [Bacteroidota bacterium]
MRKLTAFVVVVCACISTAVGQHDPQYSLNFYNQLAYNPGYAGSGGAICAIALYRNQWMGFDGAPKTMALSVHGPIDKISSGAGISILNDQIGYSKDLYFNLDYAYRLQIDDNNTLGMGVGLGFINRSIDGDWVSPDVLQGNTQNSYDDPMIPHSGSNIAFDSNLGLYFDGSVTKEQAFFASLGITHLTRPSSKIDKASSEHSYYARHLFLSGGYDWQMAGKKINIQPLFVLQSDTKLSQLTVGGRAFWQKQFWGGVMYRVGDAIIPMIGANLVEPAGLGFGIAYDITLSKLASYTSGSFEVFVRYCFNLEVNNQRGTYRSVRFL